MPQDVAGNAHGRVLGEKMVAALWRSPCGVSMGTPAALQSACRSARARLVSIGMPITSSGSEDRNRSIRHGSWLACSARGYVGARQTPASASAVSGIVRGSRPVLVLAPITCLPAVVAGNGSPHMQQSARGVNVRPLEGEGLADAQGAAQHNQPQCRRLRSRPRGQGRPAPLPRPSSGARSPALSAPSPWRAGSLPARPGARRQPGTCAGRRRGPVPTPARTYSFFAVEELLQGRGRQLTQERGAQLGHRRFANSARYRRMVLGLRPRAPGPASHSVTHSDRVFFARSPTHRCPPSAAFPVATAGPLAGVKRLHWLLSLARAGVHRGCPRPVVYRPACRGNFLDTACSHRQPSPSLS